MMRASPRTPFLTSRLGFFDHIQNMMSATAKAAAAIEQANASKGLAPPIKPP